MALTKATIEVLDSEAIDPARLPRFLTVQFNPTEYTLSKGAQIAEIAIYGIDSPILQFIRGQNEKLTLDLFFDTTTNGNGLGEGADDVTRLTNPFYQLVKIQPKTHAPPRIRFTWGQGLSFKAIVESVQRKFTLFNPQGMPLRATLNISCREYKTLEEQVAELNLQSTNHSKTHVVQRGDTLSRIATAEYNDPTAWRTIGDANPKVINPRRLEPGLELHIPPLDVFGVPLVK
jgi:Contractile injection system tube protein/LysM domain